MELPELVKATIYTRALPSCLRGRSAGTASGKLVIGRPAQPRENSRLRAHSVKFFTAYWLLASVLAGTPFAAFTRSGDPTGLGNRELVLSVASMDFESVRILVQ